MTAIRTDQGTEYKGVFDSVCDLLQINHNLATAYHPQTLGALERNHRCLNEYLRIFISELKNNWDNWLQYYCFSYNTTPNSDHKFSPFEIVFGKPITQFKNFNLTTIELVYNHSSYVNELKYKLQSIHKYILEKILQTKTCRTDKANRSIDETNVKIGDEVYLKVEGRRKFDRVHEGPYSIIALSETNAEIQHKITNHTITVHKTRLVKHKK